MQSVMQFFCSTRALERKTRPLLQSSQADPQRINLGTLRGCAVSKNLCYTVYKNYLNKGWTFVTGPSRCRFFGFWKRRRNDHKLRVIGAIALCYVLASTCYTLTSSASRYCYVSVPVPVRLVAVKVKCCLVFSCNVCPVVRFRIRQDCVHDSNTEQVSSSGMT